MIDESRYVGDFCDGDLYDLEDRRTDRQNVLALTEETDYMKRLSDMTREELIRGWYECWLTLEDYRERCYGCPAEED